MSQLDQVKPEAPPQALDRSDVRVRHDEGIWGTVRAFIDRVRSGDLGMLPVAVGLVVISAVFTALNPVYLAPNNLVNLLFDCATVGIISLGVVCVLMLGEIDLSVGSMSGLASAGRSALPSSRRWSLALSSVAFMRCSTTGWACPALSRRLRACSPCWVCSSTSWAMPDRSICPISHRW